ncbi:anthrone oxygenase family protein [Azospirillum rugosum]|uniref:Nitrate/nitrite transporter NarK n=1 Tax=Azospirillum rugosum TaxID=416170 RepID=A0ABS4SSV4_9PROT|nr:anthrone oxygenase family protein [Azospirillum rugosum]MBP2294445.1 nitrate/nitrite transporter NarK [Azospirillum rugosum]MDQ0528950.1 nitrate/nitrite transporter NarK [Azospirillum rugosum]
MTMLRLFTIAVMAIILVPSGAHLFELPAKIGMEREPYFVVQGVYAGWALFGVPIIVAVFANGALAVLERRRDRAAARWAGVAALLVLLSLVVFFAWIFPANQETANWTRQPENWEALRRRWEWAHAANALIVFGAFLATCMAVVRR